MILNLKQKMLHCNIPDIECFDFDFRRTPLQVPRSRLRSRLHPAVQSSAAPSQSRLADRETQKQTFPLSHLRKGFRN